MRVLLNNLTWKLVFLPLNTFSQLKMQFQLRHPFSLFYYPRIIVYQEKYRRLLNQFGKYYLIVATFVKWRIHFIIYCQGRSNICKMQMMVEHEFGHSLSNTIHNERLLKQVAFLHLYQYHQTTSQKISYRYRLLLTARKVLSYLNMLEFAQNLHTKNWLGPQEILNMQVQQLSKEGSQTKYPFNIFKLIALADIYCYSGNCYRGNF